MHPSNNNGGSVGKNRAAERIKRLNWLGLSVLRLKPEMIEPIKELSPSCVQVCFHLGPPQELVNELVQVNIPIIGKFIPTRKQQTRGMWKYYPPLFKKWKGLIRIWDFGGEPDTGPDQPGCRWFKTRRNFYQNMKAFYLEGKSVDENFTIGGCGFSSSFNGVFGNQNKMEFLEEILDMGVGEYLDFASFNHYVYGYGGEKNILFDIEKARRLLAEHDLKIPLTVSETGVSAELLESAFSHVGFDEKRQAEKFVKIVTLFIEAGIETIMWHALKCGGWGLLRPDNSKRPIFQAFKFLSKTLKYCHYDQQVKVFPEKKELTDFVQRHRFFRDNERRLPSRRQRSGLFRFLGHRQKSSTLPLTGAGPSRGLGKTKDPEPLDIIWLDTNRRLKAETGPLVRVYSILGRKTKDNRCTISSTPVILEGTDFYHPNEDVRF